MKKLILFFLFTSLITFGQQVEIEQITDFDPPKYYPLQVGNKWVYESSGHWTKIKDSSIWVYTWMSPLSVEVVDTALSNVRVFELLITRKNIFNQKIETQSWYETFYEECEVYSSFSVPDLFNGFRKRIELCTYPGDSTQFKFFDYRSNNLPVTLYHMADSTINLFGENTTAQIFEKTTVDEFYNVKLAQGFGLTEQHGGAYDDRWVSHLTLKGAVIDGVVYGNTSLIVSVENEKDLPQNISFTKLPKPIQPKHQNQVSSSQYREGLSKSL